MRYEEAVEVLQLTDPITKAPITADKQTDVIAAAPTTQIPQVTIEAIKTRTDIVSLIQSRGIALKKNGKGYMGHCPFHEDKTASLSVTPGKNLFQCFGCGAGGDVIRFVELYDRVDFKEAVKQLGGTSSDFSFNRPNPPASPPPPPSLPEPPAAKVQAYLERVIAVYESNFAQKGSAQAYLADRGITDADLLTPHAVGYCDGTLHEILPNDGEIPVALKQMGVLFENGSERFKDCVVFPIRNPDGHVTTLYGRHIEKKRHIYLPDRPTGLWNAAILKTSPEIILTESVLDALSVQMAGFSNVISIQGTNGLTQQDIEELTRYRVQKITLLLDGDEAGKKASRRLKEKLSGFAVEIKNLPDSHDPNSYLTTYGPQRLGELIRTTPKEAPDTSLQKPTEVPRTKTTTGDVIVCGQREYRIMSLDRGPNKLKVTIRIEHGGKLHIDTLDLYIARARTKLAADLCGKFQAVPERIEADINRIIRECESMTDESSQPAEEKPQVPIITDRERKEAEAFGRSKNLMEQILSSPSPAGTSGSTPAGPIPVCIDI